MTDKEQLLYSTFCGRLGKTPENLTTQAKTLEGMCRTFIAENPRKTIGQIVSAKLSMVKILFLSPNLPLEGHPNFLDWLDKS